MRGPLGEEKVITIRQEVGKLVVALLRKEIRFQTWVANPVLVRNSNGKWRMCVKFRDLNKACPKDSYPLPLIDKLVYTTSGHELLRFMDSYSGYNQIRMAEGDTLHTAFYVDSDIYIPLYLHALWTAQYWHHLLGNGK